MTFRPDELDAFRALFEEASPRIRAFPGCGRLELWEDAHSPNILSTYSRWETEEALDAYRQSELFKTTWTKTRPLFAAAPVANSQRVVVDVSR